MILSCANCSTRYSLDDNLVPAGGAPVQCTRCGHVFTANPLPSEAEESSSPFTPLSEVETPTSLGLEMDEESLAETTPVPNELQGHLLKSVASIPPASPLSLQEPKASKLTVRSTSPKPSRMHLKFWLLISVSAFLCLIVGWRIHRQQAHIPKESAVSYEQALRNIRADDENSRSNSLKLLEELLRAPRRPAGAYSAYLIALSLHWDEVRLRLRREEATIQLLRAKIRDLELYGTQSPAESEKLQKWKKQLEENLQVQAPLKIQSVAIEKQVETAFRELQAFSNAEHVSENREFLQAEAIYWAVQGNEKTAGTLMRLRRQFDSSNDEWADVALAEYAVNARVSTEALVEIRESMRRLRRRDSTIFRAYILEARACLELKDWDGTVSALEQLMILKPEHPLAQFLVRWVDDIRRGTSTPGTLFAQP